LATISSGLCLFLTRDPSSFSSHEPYFKADHFKGGGSNQQKRVIQAIEFVIKNEKKP